MTRILILVLAAAAIAQTAHAFNPQPDPPREQKTITTQPENITATKPSKNKSDGGKAMMDYIASGLD